MSGSSLEFDARHANGDTLTLVDERGVRLDSSVADDGTLEFQLPSQPLGHCLDVQLSPGRQRVAGGRVSTEPHSRFLSLLNQVERHRRQAQRAEQALSANLSEIRRLEQSLAANRAYRSRSQTCALPQQRSLPPEPSARCRRRDSCESDARLICATRFLGVVGCSEFAGRVRVPGVVAGPTCSAMVARFARERYSMNDFFADALWSFIDEQSARLRQSESNTDQVFGWVLGFAASANDLRQFNQCREAFVQRHWVPRARWLANVQEIREEPGRLRNACQSHTARRTALGEAQDALRHDVRTQTQALQSAERQARQAQTRFDRVSSCR
jgi:hypothetical protein